MQDHGFVYFMLFITLWAVLGLANEVIHFRSYLATIIALVIKEIPTPRRPASTSPSPSQTT